MNNLYTIGFSKKTAKNFFYILKEAGVKKVIDTRRNNVSQLAGFTKKRDLEYFLEIHNIEYSHNLDFAPTLDMLKDYQNKNITWDKYDELYTKLIIENKSLEKYDISYFNHSCLMCSESTSEYCHRGILAEMIKKKFLKGMLKVLHL